MLTKKQKEEKAAAEIRKQALLASGVQIEGLQQQQTNGTHPPRKVTYGNRKKKGPASNTKEASPAAETPEETEIPASEILSGSLQKAPKDVDDIKDEWDVESDKDQKPAVPAPVEDVKDDWDASSDEEGKAVIRAPVEKTPMSKAVNKPTAEAKLQG